MAWRSTRWPYFWSNRLLNSPASWRAWTFAADLALELRQVGLHAFIMGIGLLPGPFGKSRSRDAGGAGCGLFGHDFALDDLLGHHLRVELFDFQERLRDQQLAFVVHPGFHGARQPLGLHILDSGVAPGVELRVIPMASSMTMAAPRGLLWFTAVPGPGVRRGARRSGRC
jgi:hypothetical protein